jgi:hypothetical protein
MYFHGNKCKEQNTFMAISEDVYEEAVEDPPMAESPKFPDLTYPLDPLEVESIISLNSIIGLSSPQTLKLIGYIKHQKVIIIFDIDNIHNFIHCCIAQETNFYMREINNFQIIISISRSMKCGESCENVCLQIDQYHMKYYMFSIDMSGCDIVLGVEWLRNLDPILMDFKEIIMQFHKEGKQYKFQGITTGSLEIISSHHMEKAHKKRSL